jgi:hypothetical protein
MIMKRYIYLALFLNILRPEPGAAQAPSPGVRISQIQTDTVKRYEMLEVHLELTHVEIENPYDPLDVDVYALFFAPSGEQIRINGFYDNHRDADQWKIRFSPGETGAYSFRVFVEDGGKSGESGLFGFTATESKHPGWIRPSDVNPHYFVYDDGSTYYGVGVYSPWRNNMQRFETYAEHGANLFAIWDITYGGFVNGTGLIEEELGRYNQLKLGRIDSLLVILEERDIQLMYAIWPHDLFSETVWAAQWKQNPYSQLVDAEEVYSDSVVWEYQKQKYRYMIARFAHSRSMGIWELINEMNGTDGWAKGRHQECYDWVERCQKYFRENDPYRHPVTASFSGGFGEYREKLHELIDVPNIHIYPAQGWEPKYPEDLMRSAMYNYAWASRRFWDRYEKPAIFGEAGANLAYFDPKDPEYHTSYHNQIWASLTNGLAAIPVWWDYPVLTAEDWDQLQSLAVFVRDLDLGNKPFKPLSTSADGIDLYVMGTGDEAFGWGRSFKQAAIRNAEFCIQGLEDSEYTIYWYDTWSGEIFRTETESSREGVLPLKVPAMKKARADVALKIARSVVQ